MPKFLSDIEISRLAKLWPIEKIAAKAGIPAKALYQYGPFKAKLALDYVAKLLPKKPRAKLILVTAISPTPAGEGKTTTTIGLGDALNRIGKKTVICLREPSLGPCFGMKGGATGGGRAQVAPMGEINLHFTGDFHAIASANNLLAALLDNHIYWGNALGLDKGKISWRRCLDMNDRALRRVTVSNGTKDQREENFDIAVASEVMAIFCLATSLADLEERMNRAIIGRNGEGKNVLAAALKAAPAMTALLRDALQPNIAQTLDHSPALIHGGPFANIAHGCNSIMATGTAMRLADYVVTEAGFGADLGAEKFFDIKCRVGKLKPDAAVVVATVRALKMHGGVAKTDLGKENVEAVKAGLGNLLRHVENVQKFGLPVAVAINHFTTDTAAETKVILDACAARGVKVHLCRHWAEGGKGAVELAKDVAKLADGGTAKFKMLYPDTMPLDDKIRTIAREIYRAKDVDFSEPALEKLRQFAADGFGHLPVCMAKTQYSFSADPALRGAPVGFTLPVRDVRLSAGAGFVVVLCGDILTMPGLPREPAAERIYVDKKGLIQGLS